jgi:hypothetical protein
MSSHNITVVKSEDDDEVPYVGQVRFDCSCGARSVWVYAEEIEQLIGLHRQENS